MVTSKEQQSLRRIWSPVTPPGYPSLKFRKTARVDVDVGDRFYMGVAQVRVPQLTAAYIYYPVC